jgi:hypothetical protein
VNRDEHGSTHDSARRQRVEGVEGIVQCEPLHTAPDEPSLGQGQDFDELWQ